MIGHSEQEHRQAEYERWQELSRNSTLSRLDMARNVAQDAGDIAPLLRGLSVEPLFLRPYADGTVDVSTDSNGDRFVHAFTSHVRLAASVAIDADNLTVQQVLLAQWAASLPRAVGVRLDAGTAYDISLDARQVLEVRAITAGVPTRSALRAVNQHEALHLVPGPGTVTALDQQVLAAVTTHAGPHAAAATRRAGARLDGIGGRDWAVYYLPDSLGTDMLAAIGKAVPLHVVLIPETRDVPEDAVTYRAQAVLLSQLSQA